MPRSVRNHIHHAHANQTILVHPDKLSRRMLHRLSLELLLGMALGAREYHPRHRECFDEDSIDNVASGHCRDSQLQYLHLIVRTGVLFEFHSGSATDETCSKCQWLFCWKIILASIMRMTRTPRIFSRWFTHMEIDPIFCSLSSLVSMSFNRTTAVRAV